LRASHPETPGTRGTLEVELISVKSLHFLADLRIANNSFPHLLSLILKPSIDSKGRFHKVALSLRDRKAESVCVQTTDAAVAPKEITQGFLCDINSKTLEFQEFNANFGQNFRKSLSPGE
jgi:hypothetical protein